MKLKDIHPAAKLFCIATIFVALTSTATADVNPNINVNNSSMYISCISDDTPISGVDLFVYPEGADIKNSKTQKFVRVKIEFTDPTLKPADRGITYMSFPVVNEENRGVFKLVEPQQWTDVSIQFKGKLVKLSMKQFEFNVENGYGNRTARFKIQNTSAPGGLQEGTSQMIECERK